MGFQTYEYNTRSFPFGYMDIPGSLAIGHRLRTRHRTHRLTGPPTGRPDSRAPPLRFARSTCPSIWWLKKDEGFKHGQQSDVLLVFQLPHTTCWLLGLQRSIRQAKQTLGVPTTPRHTFWSRVSSWVSHPSRRH